MKPLVKLQAFSLMSRLVAMFLGLVQTFVIVRVLSVEEWGIVQLAVSIGGAFGIYQHLGLASGSTREISGTKDPREIFKIFFTTVFIRYSVTIPIFIFLFFSAEKIALNQYNNPALILPIKIYALGLVVEAVQSILNAVVSGTHRFKQLFIYQALISLVSVFLYVPLVYFYKINGYFYALFLFEFISSAVMGIIAFKPYWKDFCFPSYADFKRLLKSLLSISLAIYAVKIIYTWWEKSGALLLGLDLSAEMVAFFSFGLLYAKKLMLISDAVTTVNLPVLSEKYTTDLDEFKELFINNFNKLYVFILGSGFFAVFWAREVFFILVGSDKYHPALPLVLPLMFAFIFYSFMNIIESSVIIPAKKVLVMLLSFGLMLGVTVGMFFLTRSLVDPLISMSYSVALGSFMGLIAMLVLSKITLDFSFFEGKHLLLLGQIMAMSLPFMLETLWIKAALFVVFGALYLKAVFLSGFMSKEQILGLGNRTLYLVRALTQHGGNLIK
ncbi:oligosaccharide flippase family protein [Patescibacteria group bacterium]|nr:oligosaccharide flippase family protein [Patescibacteria group bacterium]HOM77586.1 oligosaccharide flippase family protein [bacterium]